MFEDENRHYGLRKLSVGLASVLIGISFASTTGNSVKADTVNSGSNDAQTIVKSSDAATKIDVKDDTNAIESNTESAPEASKKDPNAITQDIKQKAIKASEAVTKMQNVAETIAKGNAPEAAAKNATDGGQAAVKSATESTLKGANLIAKQQNTAVKDNADASKDDSSNVAEKDSLTAKNNALKATVEAAKQGLETPAVAHSDGNETTLNVKGSNAITENMLKEDKDDQAGADLAKSKLKLAALLTTTGKKFNAQMLSESKVMTPAKDTNGGFDEATWGTLDVNNWKGNVQGDYYQLTDYTGDANHVIVPNEADFAKAGISTSGKQVGVTRDLMHTIFRDKTTAQDATVAFSKTGNKRVKAINADWNDTWGHYHEHVNGSWIYSKGKLTRFDGSNLDVANVTDMAQMFDSNQISDLSSLANWNVSNVTNMHAMFADNQISDLSPLSNWKTDNATNMTGMFGSNQISDLSPLSNWNVSNVTTMHGMFYSNQISDLSPLSNWNTGKVTDMQYMFYENKIIDLSALTNWNVSSVTDMTFMFSHNHISDLSPLANWNVSSVTDMTFMFSRNHISDLSPLANWNVSNVTNMARMFNDNATTQTKNLQAKRVINFIYPDGYTGKPQDSVTQTVNVSQKVRVVLTTKDSKPSDNILDWVTKKEIPEDQDPVYFQDYTVPEIKGLLEPDKTVISGQQADITKPINVTVTYKLADSNTNDAFALDSKNGLHEHANVNDNGGYDEDYWGKINVDDWNYTANGDRIEINSLKDGISTGANDAVIVPNLDDFKLAGKDGGAKTVYISSSALGKTAQHKYYGLSKTNGNKFATDSDLHSVFDHDSNLAHVDLNSLDTSNVTDMSKMFDGASHLTSLDVSNWDTRNVTDMSHMFSSASSLTSLDVSKWNTGNVTNMRGMFASAEMLTSLDVSNWNTGNVTDMGYMFNHAKSLTDFDVSHWDIGNVTNMYAMFSHARDLTSLDVSKWKTDNVTDMGSMFSDASSLTSLDVSNWNTGNVTDMNWMFGSASNLTTLDVSNWDTSKVTAMSYMFYGASGLTDLDVSNWNTGNVTAMRSMFSGASGLTDLDVSNWNTGNVTDMNWMFGSASNLTTLDVSNWDTGNVINMGGMFMDASRLTSLDVSNWNTSKVTDMRSMFNGISSLTNLDVSNWKTDNVTDMSFMFYNASGLTSLDVSKWDTSKVTDMSYMFYNASSLALIANSGKFADYLVNHDSFANSKINSNVLSVTTDNAKLLQLLTNDSQHDSATRTIIFTFPANYSPDLDKYHLIKVGNTYQIKQSADYDKQYLQGTVLINATYDIAYHHIDTTKKNKLSDTWQPNYDKLVLAHKNADGTVSFDDIQLPQIPGYKTVASPVNPARALFAVSFMALPKPVTPAINDAKPDKTVSPATPEVAKPIKTEPKVTTPAAIKTVDLSDDVVATTPDVSTWQVADEPNQDTYHVSNGQYAIELPHISNAQLHVIANDSTKDSILFTYKGQNNKYVFKIKFANGHYLLTTYKIKSGKLVKLIDYNFIKSSKMIDVILAWIKL